MRIPFWSEAGASGRPAAEAARLHRRRLVLLALVVAAAVLVVAVPGMHALAREAVGYAERVVERHPVWGAVVFTLLAAASAMLAFFSSAVVVPVGIAAWGTPTTFLLLVAGWLAGGLLAYGIGRGLGRPVLVALVPAAKLEYYEKLLARRVGFGFVLLVQFTLPSEIAGYLLGAMRFPLPTYLAALTVAEIPYAIGAVLLGASFLQGDLLPLAGLGVAAIAATVLAARRLRLSEPDAAPAGSGGADQPNVGDGRPDAL